MTLLLSTVVFILGFQAVGPARSLTNPHHGIGLAIYVLIWVQFLGGWWIHRREKGRTRYRLPVKLYLHQWLGRATALLGIAQVPLGLTLYGSPKFTFILYTLWMTFLLVLYFILSYRATAPIGGATRTESVHGGTVIEEKRRGRFGGLLGPLAVGAGAAALLSRRNKSRSRSRVRTEEVIPSRRGSRRGSRRDSESFIEEKYEERPREGDGLMDKLLKGAALVGAAGLAKSWYDRRQRKKEEDEYTSVAHDTPSRRHRRHPDSVSEDSLSVHRMEQGRLPSGSRRSNILQGPGDPVAAATAISAADARPVTPRPTHGRTHSFDSASYSYDSTLSPSRRPHTPPSNRLRNTIAASLGVAWVAKKFKDRRDRKEQERLDEEERIQRTEGRKYTGDGFPSPSRRHGRRGSRTESSDLSSVIDDPHHIRPGGIPPIPAALGGAALGAAAGAAMSQSRSRHDISEQLSMPPAPPDPQGVLHQESGSEQYFSSGGAPHRRHSSRRRREGEVAAAAAVAGAAELAAEEEMRRRRSRSRHSQGDAVVSPPVSVKVKMHGDRDRNVTLRRLTEEEAAAEREARRGHRRRRADSISSLSGTDTATSRRRYRRDDRERREADEIAAEKLAEAGAPPAMAPLSPPNPAFAGGKRPKDSAYYSGRPGSAGGAGPSGSGYVAGSAVGGGSMGSHESHGTWSGMSPASGRGSGEDAAERRRRRRLERSQRGTGTTGTVDFT